MKLKLLKDHPHGGSFWYRPEKEKADLYVLKEMGTYWKRISIDKKQVWLDAGANIGAFSVRLAHQVQRVVAVEASKSNYRLLTRNLKQNGCANVVALQGAIVGRHLKQVRLVLDTGPGGPGRHSLYRVHGTSVMVPALNISHIVKEYKIDCLKLDIEGAEYESLIDLYKTGQIKKIKQVVLEFHFSMLKDKDRAMFQTVHKILEKNFRHVEGHTVKKAKELNLWTTLMYASKE